MLQLDTTQWGWIQLIWGSLIAVAGGYVLTGSCSLDGRCSDGAGQRGRRVRVVALRAVWGVTIIAIAVSLIWALTAHGRDVVEGDGSTMMRAGGRWASRQRCSGSRRWGRSRCGDGTPSPGTTPSSSTSIEKLRNVRTSTMIPSSTACSTVPSTVIVRTMSAMMRTSSPSRMARPMHVRACS